MVWSKHKLCAQHSVHNYRLVRDMSPLAPKAGIIPLDQRATKSIFYVSFSEIGQMLTGSTSVTEKLYANNSRNGLFNKNT